MGYVSQPCSCSSVILQYKACLLFQMFIFGPDNENVSVITKSGGIYVVSPNHAHSSSSYCYICTGITLKRYQLDGVRWLTQCLKTLDGCILGDEMGLGKTCQVRHSDVFLTVTSLQHPQGCVICYNWEPVDTEASEAETCLLKHSVKDQHRWETRRLGSDSAHFYSISASSTPVHNKRWLL